MERQSGGDALVELTEAVAVQDELVQHRLAMEWAKTLFDRLLRHWTMLETHEGIAYEDKVVSQLRMLDEAMAGLSDLHRTLGQFSRVLKDHRQHLSRMKNTLGISQTLE